MVDRNHTGNMKLFITPESLQERGITSFSAAEMDFPTAPSIIDSVVRMAKGGVYGFTIPTAEYYDAVRWWLREVRNWDVPKEWIGADGCSITEEYLAYARPLIMGELFPIYENGVPKHLIRK